MIKFKEINKPLKKIKKSSIEDRWKEDAKWFREDAKRHPEKYQTKNDEDHVSSEELDDYLKNFIKEGNKSYSATGSIVHKRNKSGRARLYTMRQSGLSKSKNNKGKNIIQRYSKKK